MAPPLGKSQCVLLALGLLVLACPTLLAEDNDVDALNQKVKQLIEQETIRRQFPLRKERLKRQRACVAWNIPTRRPASIT